MERLESSAAEPPDYPLPRLFLREPPMLAGQGGPMARSLPARTLVETLEREQIDLILSDVRLGGTKSGLEIAHEAKRRNIPLLFVTGHPPDNACDLALGCLLKPYNDRTLKAALSAIDKLLGGGSPKPPKGLTLYSPKADTSAST